jgi:hypothetical protein
MDCSRKGFDRILQPIPSARLGKLVLSHSILPYLPDDPRSVPKWAKATPFRAIGSQGKVRTPGGATRRVSFFFAGFSVKEKLTN